MRKRVLIFILFLNMQLPLLIAYSLFHINKYHEKTISTELVQIRPGCKKAFLRLSDNRTIYLTDSISDQVLDEQGTVVRLMSNSLVYEDSSYHSAKPGKEIFNVLNIPKGGEYKLQLSDGTMVWLNSDTEISFPVHFVDSVRRVFLKGEAFFDVSHNGKPFEVITDLSTVKVLGTAFNISAYEEDNFTSTTLIHGKVKVSGSHLSGNKIKEMILAPGEQALVTSDKMTVEHVNVQNIIAWKEGKFIFNNEPLDMVLLKLSRWYNFNFSFKEKVFKQKQFSGRLDRNTEFEDVLEIIRISSNIKIEKDNKLLIINQ
jgi:transmembrane sensor